MANLFDTIEKPTLLLDETAARRNIRRMAEHARMAGVTFRPHFKTHQSAKIGEWFHEEGITAITVSSADMALYFAQNGWKDITIAFPANLRQGHTLAELARQVNLGLLVESAETIQRLSHVVSAPVDLWIKIDTGLHRTGLAWDQMETIVQVARSAIDARPMRLRGILTHSGQTYTARGAEEVCRQYHEGAQRMDRVRQALQQLGMGPLEISVGDTPGTSLCSNLGPVNEIRPGNFVFFDAQQVQIGSCQWADVAVALACPVVACHPDRNELVMYGGAIHLSKDYLVEDGVKMYGRVCLPDPQTGKWGEPLPGAYVSALSQEHGVLRMRAEDLQRMQVGDLVCILPAHSCLTVTLMKYYLTLNGRRIDTMNV